MKARELAEVLLRDLDAEIVVRVQNGWFPGTPAVRVEGTSKACDWDEGKVILLTDAPVVPVKKLDRPIRDVAREHLERLKAAHVAVHGPGARYIPKAREEDWIDGCEAGVRMHITACDVESNRATARPGSGK